MQSLCSRLGGSELPQAPGRNLREPAQAAPNKKRSPRGTARPPHGAAQPPASQLLPWPPKPLPTSTSSQSHAGEPAPPTSVLMATFFLPITGPVSRGRRQHYVTERFPTELTQSPATISKRLELQGKKHGGVCLFLSYDTVFFQRLFIMIL